MRQKPGTRKSHGEKVVKDIRRATRKQYSAEEKIRIVLDGLQGRGQHRGAVPPRRHRSEPLLQLVQGVPGGREEAACGDTARAAIDRGSEGPAPGSP